MLNLFKVKKNKYDINIEKKKQQYKLNFYPYTYIGWSDSIYLYNKTYVKLLPQKDNLVNKLIKSFFNLTFLIRNKILSYRRRIRYKKISTNRILVSKAYLGHTNNKVIVNIFTFNREKYFLLKKMIEIYKRIIKKKRYNHITRIIKRKTRNILIGKKLQDLRYKTLKAIISRDKNSLKRKIKNEKRLILKTLKWKTIKLLRLVFLYQYKRQYTKILKLECLFYYYNKILLLNSYKFKEFFILRLKALISKIYEKNVEFRIVNLKHLYLNSDIFLQSIAIKLKTRKYNAVRVLENALTVVKIPFVRREAWLNYSWKCRDLRRDLPDNSSMELLIEDYNNIHKQISKKKSVLISLKSRRVNGVRLVAAGRLTRRLTASRSLFKFRYKGTLKNIYSSYSGLSTPLYKGYFKSNLQHTKIKSKTRNGAFGLKGWVNSY